MYSQYTIGESILAYMLHTIIVEIVFLAMYLIAIVISVIILISISLFIATIDEWSYVHRYVA